jgi:metallo-beta-lactamase class B
MKLSLLLPILWTAATVSAQSNAQERAAWNRPVKPFRIAGNVHYVGLEGVSAFLITTPEGAILLDGGFEESAPLIAKNIAELGVHMRDVKFLLNSHAHYDHSGGLAALKKMSGAKMVASQGDSGVLRSGREIVDDGEDRLFPPVKIDRVIRDHETVSLGGTALTAHLTPGHTPGCTTWSVPISSNGKTLHVVFYCSTTVVDRLVNNRRYPGIVADYERSFTVLRDLPCDVFLAPHPGFFHLEDKRNQLDAGRGDAFVDSTEMRKFVDDSRQSFEKDLAEQRAAAKKR